MFTKDVFHDWNKLLFNVDYQFSVQWDDLKYFFVCQFQIYILGFLKIKKVKYRQM